MKINEKTKLTGVNVILIPYEKHHVPKYHDWMKSEELQALTASEPLSLDQEYDMQKSWREDEDKCTFIVLDKTKYKDGDEIGSMIGDTNIFVTDKLQKRGEIEIMIADVNSRGKKYGWETVILMLIYGIDFIKLQSFEAKISMSNIISIAMFKKLGFSPISQSDVFQEVTLGKTVDEAWTTWLKEMYMYEVGEYKI